MATDPPTHEGSGPDADDLTAEVGEVVGEHYKVLSALGEGATSSVFRAEDLRSGEQVALKVLHSDISPTSTFGKRFEREHLLASKTSHRNCVSIGDFGQLERGNLFLAMELVEGQSLGELLKDEGRLHPVRALSIMRHILRALEHVHQMGVVHRDIKPDNILLTSRQEDKDFAKLVDFGIAKVVGDELADANDPELTQVGTTVGTPKYISPEQAFGQPLDGRSDLYSASVVLYQMLAGVPPFDSEKVIDLLMMHAKEPPPPLAHTAPDAQLPSTLEALLRWGLAKDPNERPLSAAAFLREVEQLLASSNLMATSSPRLPGPPPSSPLEWARQTLHRALAKFRYLYDWTAWRFGRDALVVGLLVLFLTVVSVVAALAD